jgi:hypothetical protein
MITSWTVTSGIGGGGGAGPVIASGGQYVVDTGSEKANFIFAGVGVGVGGPASATWTDSKTPSIPGKLITAGYGIEPMLSRLTLPADGLIFTAGTAPRHLVPGGDVVNTIAGGYIQVLMFGVMSETSAITSYGIDHAVGQPNGGFFTGAYAYCELATAAKGVDAGGAGVMKGVWMKV